MLKLIPLGGLGEIGLNMMIVEYNSTIFIIDSGLMFPESHMLGVNYVIPSMEYLRENKEKVSALIITHAHEDHIGAIPFFAKEFNVPIFATQFAIEIIKYRLKEHSVDVENILNIIIPNKKLKITPFEIDFIQVRHSIIEGLALAIKTPVGTIIHTGDFKIDHKNNKNYYTDLSAFSNYGKKKVLALLSDSTNIEKDGYTVSSKKIINNLSKLIKKNNGRIIIALFSSNISRIKQIIKIAKINGRKIIFNGKSLEISVKIARKLGYIDLPEEMEIGIRDINSIPCNKLLILTTGSQGEPMSALNRIAYGIHKQISIQKKDVVILSSKFIPGNQKAISNIINKLYKKGAQVIYEKISNIHVSGHAQKEELKFMMHIVNPKFFMPIHGEYRHLFLHCKLAHEYGIPKTHTILAQDGKMIKIDNNSYKILDNLKYGRILIDGKGVGDIEENTLKERQILSKNGFIAINIAFNEETGTVAHGPKLIFKGVILEHKIGQLSIDTQCIILEIINKIKENTPNRIEKIKSRIKNTLNQYLFYSLGRKPIIVVFIIEI